MRLLRAFVLGIGFAALAAACSTQLQSDSPPVKKIAVVQPPEPAAYSAEVSHPTGVIGRVFDTVRGASTDDEKFSAGLRGKGFAISARLAERATQALRARGYEATLVRGAYVRRGDIIVMEIDKSRYEALLTFDFDSVGYAAPRAGEPYRPQLAVSVTLAPTAVTEIFPLYKQSLVYGWEGHIGGGTQVPAPRQISYAGFDQLMARQLEAGQQLYAGADLIAERIAADLAPRR